MNRKERRAAKAQGKDNTVVEWGGKEYTVEEAYALAANALNQRNQSSAAEIFLAIIAKAPGYPGVYNGLGIALHEMGRYEDAIKIYDRAIALDPSFAEAHSNRASALQVLKRYNEALASYNNAIALNPNVSRVYNNCGVTLYEMQRYGEALAHYDKAIALTPGFAEAYNNRGIALQKMMRYQESLASYDKAIALASGYADAYSNRSVTLQHMLMEDEALASCDKAIALQPRFVKTYNNRAITLQKMKRYDEALASCDKAIALQPDYAAAWHTRGLILVNKGKMQEAEEMFLKALAMNPDFPDSVFSLANIRKYKDADHADVKRIETMLANGRIAPQDKDFLHFALGKIYDDCGLYDKAFECYRQANQICNAVVSYNAANNNAIMDSLIQVFSRDFFSTTASLGSPSRTPIFIVGMPRSGTTLMASILSNHPHVGTAGELPTITEFNSRLKQLTGVTYPQAVTHMTPAMAATLAEEYEKRLRRDFGANPTYVVDKNPLNFLHLGLIATLFPNAHVIHCIRHPLDIVLSNYFQRFTLHYDYSFDLRNISHFYNEYNRLMEHWRQTLPLKMMEVRYEDMIAATEPTARKVLDFIGLEWDERCLSPHTNPTPVETVSQWQVRQPIYTQSMERWRHYETHLAPVKEILGLDPA